MSKQNITVSGEPQHFASKSQTIDGWNRIDVGQQDEAVVSGDRPLDPILEESIGQETELILPRGTYKLNNPAKIREFDRLAIRGRPSATIKIENDIEYGLIIGATAGTDPEDTPTEFQLENVTFDVTADNVGPVCLRARVSDRLIVNNVRIKGEIDSPNIRKLGTCLFAVTSWQGQGYVNIKMEDGAAFRPGEFDMSDAEAQIEHPIGINSPSDHRGNIIFDRCRVEGFPNNGFYLAGGDPPEGSYVVRHCTAKNNGNGNIRVGPNDVVEDSYVLLDNMSNLGLTGCGIWAAKDGATIRDCRIVGKDTDNDLLRVSADATIRGLKMENQSPCKAIDLPRSEWMDILLDDVTLLDKADDSGPAYACEMDTHGVTLRDCKFRIKQDGRRGVYAGGNNVDMDGCTFQSEGSGEAVAIDGRNSNVTRGRIGGGFVARNGGPGLMLSGNRIRGRFDNLDKNQFAGDNLIH